MEPQPSARLVRNAWEKGSMKYEGRCNTTVRNKWAEHGRP